MADISENEPIPSVKDLASSEPSIRRSCLKTIVTHLTQRGATLPLTTTQALQIWRGLYVAVYMHDSKNAISVQNLIAEVAGLVEVIAQKDKELIASTGQHGSWLDTWTTAFWETIAREWTSIDQWRINKVMLLVRLFLRETFRSVLASVSTDESYSTSESDEIIKRQVHVLESWPLSPRERKVPDGLRLHVLDVWSDELVAQLNATQGQQGSTTDATRADVPAKPTAVANAMMAPIERLGKEALSKGVRIRAKEALRSFQEAA